jgi:hypothetical protein
MRIVYQNRGWWKERMLKTLVNDARTPSAPPDPNRPVCARDLYSPARANNHPPASDPAERRRGRLVITVLAGPRKNYAHFCKYLIKYRPEAIKNLILLVDKRTLAATLKSSSQDLTRHASAPN